MAKKNPQHEPARPPSTFFPAGGEGRNQRNWQNRDWSDIEPSDQRHKTVSRSVAQRCGRVKDAFTHTIKRVASGRTILRRNAGVRGSHSQLAADVARREAAELLIEQSRDTRCVRRS